MIDKPEIVQTESQPAAIIRLTVPRSEMQAVMGSGIGEVIAAVIAQGIGPAGPVFSHHHRMVPDMWDFEIGVPVSGPVTPVGRVVAGELPAAKVARTVYHGDYEGLGDGWGELAAWITAEGLTVAPNFWECYLTNPDTTPDPADWQTELNKPMLG
jgi:effector-binding domain-containing protein